MSTLQFGRQFRVGQSSAPAAPSARGIALATSTVRRSIPRDVVRQAAAANTQNHHHVRHAVTRDEKRLVDSEADEATVAELLARGVNPNVTATSGWTCLARASFAGSVPVIKRLIAAGAHVNVRIGLAQDTPLILASWAGHRDAVVVLIAAGADVHAANKHGETAVHKALHAGHHHVVRELVAAGALVDAAKWPGVQLQ